MTISPFPAVKGRNDLAVFGSWTSRLDSPVAVPVPVPLAKEREMFFFDHKFKIFLPDPVPVPLAVPEPDAVGASVVVVNDEPLVFAVVNDGRKVVNGPTIAVAVASGVVVCATVGISRGLGRNSRLN